MGQPFTPTILRFDSLPSTNTEAARQASLGAREGLCVVAREQTAGRGRRERAWVSPLDSGLYFSVVLRPRTDAREWPLITLASAVAARDALEEACALLADIKWPNDLLPLGESSAAYSPRRPRARRGRAVVLGVGINLNNRAFPPEILAAATSVEEQTAARPTPSNFSPRSRTNSRAATKNCTRAAARR
jgi:BirA family biotin operon repressor/biotin-[acetyl-CoA-carboxylase] ligase